MSMHCEPSSQPETALPAPDVIGVLPAVPGGEENLLPRDAWLRPLRVEFGWWDDPVTLPELADVVQLIWDDDEANPVAEKRYDNSHYPTPPLICGWKCRRHDWKKGFIPCITGCCRGMVQRQIPRHR